MNCPRCGLDPGLALRHRDWRQCAEAAKAEINHLRHELNLAQSAANEVVARASIEAQQRAASGRRRN